MEEYVVPQGAREQLARDYLKGKLGISSTLWKKIKAYNQFFVNDVQVIPGRAMVRGGDKIRFAYPVKSQVVPVEMELDIRYEDEYLLVVNKPAGQLTHPLTFEPESSLANGVMGYFKKQNILAGCHPIYRLDRNTSGLVVFAKVPQLQFWWGGDHGKLQREYYALVEGNFTEDSGQVDKPIGRVDNSMILHQVRDDGKEALTYYEVVANYRGYALVKLRLATGRTHQIRVHMSYLKHPLMGDDLYGGSREKLQRHGLHAGRIMFRHPFTEEDLVIEAPLPRDMAELVK